MQPRLGPFEVVRPLGEGGAGAVYEVRRAGDPRRLALKVQRLEGASDATRRERFRREGELLARLRHPAVVPVHEAGELPGGALYLLLDLVEGETLRALFEREAPLAPERVTRLVLDAARGLAHAHAQGIVHRDVKPENVLVDARGARVTDFGLALAADHDRLTGSRVVVGTLAALAPEQVKTHTNELGPWTDVHALGLLLHEGCTGERVFPGHDAPVIAAQVLNLRPAPLRQVAPAASAGLEAVVGKCLEKSPQARYPDAGALAADLERVLDGRAPLAARGRRGALGALVLLPVLAPLLLLAGGLFLLRGDQGPAPSPSTATAAPTSALAPAGPAPAWRLAAGDRLAFEVGWWESIERFGSTSATKPFFEMIDTAALAQRLELRVLTVAPERATLEARVVALRAAYTAAGAKALRWASSPAAPDLPTGPPRPGNAQEEAHAADGADRTDDALAALALLLDRPFTLALDPRTGSVLAVDGWTPTWSAFAVRAGVSGSVVEWDWGHPPDHQAKAYVGGLSADALRRALDLLWDVAPPPGKPGAGWTRSLTLAHTLQFERPGGLLVGATFLAGDDGRVTWKDDGGAPVLTKLGARAVTTGVKVLRYALRGEAELRAGRVARAEAEQRVETSDGERVTARFRCRDVTP